MSKLIELTRYKLTQPFSIKLNDFIINRVKNIKYEIKDFDIEDTNELYNNLKQIFDKENIIIINSKNNNNTIFGNSDINILFRVWHDYTHYINNYDFTLLGEINTFKKQELELPNRNYRFEKQLLFIEIVEQTRYRLNNGYFPINQRNFTIEELKKMI